MRSRSIGARLMGGFAVVLCLLFGIAALAGYFLVVDRDEVVRLARHDLAFLDRANEVQASHMRQSVLVRDVVSYDDVAVQRVARKAIQEEAERFRKLLGVLTEASLATADRQRISLVNALTEHHAPLPALSRQAIELVDDARFDEAKKLVYERVRPQQLVVDEDFKSLVSVVTAEGRLAAESAERRLARVLQGMGVLTAIALLVGALIAIGVTRSVSRPLMEAVGAAERVAGGDLATPIEGRSRDETGRLLNALGHMQQSLRDMVGKIRSSTLAVTQASEELVRGSTDLSRRTEQQAAALEQTASSMEELTASVSRNREGAAHADEYSRESTSLARKGGEAVDRVTATMESVGESARRIADIVSVIESIAFQTNILALNAAVEAARAGEQGRGFAVVATEVRSLAQRSAEAARDISALASESRRRVEEGGSAVESAGQTIRDIIASFERVGQVMGEIAAASVEQGHGIEQVNQTVTQLDGVTQNNARLVQESVAAANGLRSEARRLEAAVEAFTLDDAAAGAAPSRVRLALQRA
ncbi:MAG TPA: methyl-accepting chemotaxis protein [Usitatibacter sp.]|nr:methyl-accepting chemotaxis protein [Usitatibacter sp.]